MPSDRDFEARETAVGQAIRRGWPIIAVLMLAALATSLVMTSRREPTYEATAELLISPLGQHETTFRGTDLLREAGDPAETGGTVAALIETNAAAAATARSVGGGWTAAEVLDAVEIEPIETTQILSVKATADNPATAAALATEFARSTVRLRSERIVPQIEERLEGLVERRRAAPLDDYSQRDRLFTEIRLMEDTLAGGGDPTLKFVDAAATPTAEAATSRVLIALVAMLGGLALGVVVAIVVERLRRSARTEQDLLAARPLPILARLPGGSRKTATVGPDQIGALAAQLERLGNFDQRVVLVTSACRGDGRTTVATNLAVALANSGHSTILVDLDELGPERRRMAHDGWAGRGPPPPAGGREEPGSQATGRGCQGRCGLGRHPCATRARGRGSAAGRRRSGRCHPRSSPRAHGPARVRARIGNAGARRRPADRSRGHGIQLTAEAA